MQVCCSVIYVEKMIHIFVLSYHEICVNFVEHCKYPI